MSAVSTASEMPAVTEERGVRGWLRRHPLLGYGLLAYGVSFLLTIIMVIAVQFDALSLDSPLAAVVNQVAAFSPAIAAVIVIAVTQGRAELGKFFKSMVHWRVSPAWYLLILFGLPLQRTRGQIEYFFIINAAVYLALQNLSELYGSPQMRSVAKAFRFVIPGHVMTSLLLLGLAASSRWEEALDRIDLKHEARFFEIVLPAVACLFVFGSVPKQMKNFFVTGLLFLAIGIVRLKHDLFKERPVWPISLLAAGLLLMVFAANYTPIKLSLIRLFGRRR